MNVRALHNETLSFGAFEFQPRSGRLTKYGHRIKLQPKSAAVLSCLLERPGEVVSHGQLQKGLWPEGHHVDFELGIKVAVKKLRDALGDESADPIYIQTVHGEGYRFIGTLDDSVNHPAADGAAPSKETAAALPIAPGPFFANRHTLLWTAATMVAIAAALVLIVPKTGHTAVPFQSRDWIIIVPFENRTGDGLLDGTMEYALERALSQSRYVNVAPRERIDDVLTLMRQRPDMKLNEDLARQVAIRDGGIKAVAGGRVEKLGSRYVLTVRLLNPRGGEPVVLIEKAGSKDGLLDAARSASADLRQKLGESLPDRETRAVNMEKATTPSLAALRAFSAGAEQVNLHKWSLAAPLLEEAVVQDPRFATAHIYAAHCYSNLNQPEKAAPHYQAAFQLADTVTQRERLFILGSYYGRFLNDHRSAIDTYNALVGLYPDDYWAAYNLVGEYGNEITLPERMGVLEKLDAIRPLRDTTLQLWRYYKFDQPNESKAGQYREKLRRVRQSGVIDPWADSALDLESVSTKWLGGDMTAAAEELNTLNARASDQVPAQACRAGDLTIAECNDSYKALISDANLVFGKLAAAQDWCHHMSNNEAFRHECLLRVAFAAGDRKAGKEQLRQILIIGPTSSGAATDIMLALWLGEIAPAERWAGARWVNRTVHGWLSLARGRLQEAVDQMGPGGWFPWKDYGLARALEQQGKVDQAITGLEQMRLPSNIALAWPWPQSRMKLAQLYRTTGRVAQAEKVEDDLRRYFSAADQDHPLLAELLKARATESK